MELTVQNINPLPQQYVTDELGVGGAIKQRPEDFLVDEIPLYEPCGEGEHLYLMVEKSGVAHAELMAVLRKHFRVHEKNIGYAGMKDKIGVTRQMVSIHLPGSAAPDLELPHERIGVLWASRHRNKLRRGHLQGNRFSIRVRNVSISKTPAVLRVLKRLEETGVPAYFGQQRFGYRRNNHLLGAMLLAGDWNAMAHEVIGTGYTPYPEYQQQRRELADAGDYDAALAQWSVADRAERRMLQVLSSGSNKKHACVSVDRNIRAFMVSAFQSAIFNRVLDERLQQQTIDQLFEGDIAWKYDTRRLFRVTPETLATGALQERLLHFEISPSGPIWGKTMWQAEGPFGEMEQAAFASMGVPKDVFLQSPAVPDGGRRPFRTYIRNIEVDGGADEHGEYVRAAFDLPRGTYATVVLREVMKNDDSMDEDSEAMESEAYANT